MIDENSYDLISQFLKLIKNKLILGFFNNYNSKFDFNNRFNNINSIIDLSGFISHEFFYILKLIFKNICYVFGLSQDLRLVFIKKFIFNGKVALDKISTKNISCYC
jgi:hypothetical protein